jgi:hypothetical protein
MKNPNKIIDAAGIKGTRVGRLIKVKVLRVTHFIMFVICTSPLIVYAFLSGMCNANKNSLR